MSYPYRPQDATSDFVPEWVFERAAISPQAEAVASPSCRLSYAQLAERIRRLAGFLQQLGIGPGEHVLIALPATPGTVVASLAVQLIGAVPVEAARDGGAAVMADVMTKSRPRLAFVAGRDARKWGAMFAEFPVDQVMVLHPGAPNAAMSESFGDTPVFRLGEDGLIDEAAPLAPAGMVSRELLAPALVLFTSGSAGQPCGVVLTHRNLAANARQIVDYLDLQATDRAMLVLPLSYSYGRSVLHTHLLCGGSVYLENCFMYPRVVIDAIREERCTNFSGVPMTYELLRRQVDVGSVELPALRLVTQAGGALTADGRAWVRSNFKTARFFVMYGATEATARLSYLPPERAVEKDGSIGIPLAGLTLKIVDDNGCEAADGEVGHLIASGDNISTGYLGDPELTASTFRDGWLWTGDLARKDADGFFFLVGRAKEMLKIGGHRVSPLEIEQVLLRHPAVLEGLVCGVPDPVTGEAAVAVVVGRDGQSIDAADIKRFCHDALPAYKLPKFVHIAESLPRSAHGKILRAAVAEQVRWMLAGGSSVPPLQLRQSR